MVFANLAGDPVALRLVTSFARPNKNITGNTSLSSDLTGKRLELLREAIPSLRRAAMLWDKASPAAEASYARWRQPQRHWDWIFGHSL